MMLPAYYDEVSGEVAENSLKQQKGRDAEASGGMRKRHSKAMRAPRRHARREVGIGMRLPADHDEAAGEVAEQIACVQI